MNVHQIEATCGSCGETFNPTEDDKTIVNDVEYYEHIECEDGKRCGGLGQITGAWGTPDFDFLANAGHGEYWPASLNLETVWDMDMAGAMHEDEPDYEAWPRLTGIPFERMPDVDLTWQIVVRVCCERDQLLQGIADLVGLIARPPSGDDDTFDYWPSGVRFARELAAHAGEGWPAVVERAARSALEWPFPAHLKPELYDILGLPRTEPCAGCGQPVTTVTELIRDAKTGIPHTCKVVQS